MKKLITSTLFTFFLVSSVITANPLDSVGNAVIDSVDRMEKWVGNNKLKFCLGGAVIIGASVLADKFENDDILIGAGIGAGLLGLTYAGNGVRHWWQLHTINRRLNKSRTDSKNNFLFATWQEAKWPTAKDIIDDKKEAKRLLNKDVKEGLLFVDGRKISQDQIRCCIAQEKRQLEEWLKVAGNLTSAPDQVLNFSAQLNSGKANKFVIDGLPFGLSQTE